MKFAGANAGNKQPYQYYNSAQLCRADTIRPRNPYNLIAAYFVGCGDPDAPLPRERHEIPEIFIANR